MKLAVISSLSKRKGADALILPFFLKGKAPFAEKSLLSLYQKLLKVGDFTGKKGEVLTHYPEKGVDKRLILIGLGAEKELTAEVLRRSYASGLNLVKEKVKTLNVVLPTTKELPKEEVMTAAAEGLLLCAYTFDRNRSEKDKTPSQAVFVGGDSKVIKKVEKICEAVSLTRTLVIRNADEITPTYLGKVAKEIAKKSPSATAKVLGKAQIKKEKLGLLEAVSRGADQDPALILLEYRGNPKSKEVTALVGKGVTYDTGGLNLKPTGGIETMRDDMGGAAAVLGTLQAAISLKLKVNVIGVVGSTENAIGSKSYKPGDVYQSHKGIKVEVSNTDAEGRLVLADALSYVQKHYAPKQIVDIATLTGGAVVSLGEEVSALMCNQPSLAKKLIEAGEKTYERLWELPLHEEYKKILESKVADIKNSGVRKASAIQGGIFLERFIDPKVAWGHVDIAGTAFPDSRKPYHPVQATGVGVRLLTAFLESCAK